MGIVRQSCERRQCSAGQVCIQQNSIFEHLGDGRNQQRVTNLTCAAPRGPDSLSIGRRLSKSLDLRCKPVCRDHVCILSSAFDCSSIVTLVFTKRMTLRQALYVPRPPDFGMTQKQLLTSSFCGSAIDRSNRRQQRRCWLCVLFKSVRASSRFRSCD